MTPIKQGTAARLGLRKPDVEFELDISGPAFMSGDPAHPLWLDVRAQMMLGVNPIRLDLVKLADYAEKTQDAKGRQAIAAWIQKAKKRL